MNISSLKLYRLLKKRASRLKAWIALLEKNKQEIKDSEQKYTLVDPVGNVRKLDMMNSITARQLDHERDGRKYGKARWLVNNNEQVYRPREIKLDPQLEYIYDELGLSDQFEVTSPLGANQQAI